MHAFNYESICIYKCIYIYTNTICMMYTLMSTTHYHLWSFFILSMTSIRYQTAVIGQIQIISLYVIIAEQQEKI